MYDVKNAKDVVTATMVLAEVVNFHIRKDLYSDNDGKVGSFRSSLPKSYPDREVWS